jgi:hypothetical protein
VSRQEGVMLAVLLTVAGALMAVRTLGAAARNDPVRMLRSTTSPDGVICGLLQGSPAQPGWHEAVKPFVGRPELRALLLLALSKEGELEPATRSWLSALAAQPKSATSRRASLDRLLAAFALERPSDLRAR